MKGIYSGHTLLVKWPLDQSSSGSGVGDTVRIWFPEIWGWADQVIGLMSHSRNVAGGNPSLPDITKNHQHHHNIQQIVSAQRLVQIDDWICAFMVEEWHGVGI